MIQRASMNFVRGPLANSSTTCAVALVAQVNPLQPDAAPQQAATDRAVRQTRESSSWLEFSRYEATLVATSTRGVAVGFAASFNVLS
jgi:hypothetical protein